MGRGTEEKTRIREDAVINWMVDPQDTRSAKDVADELGISQYTVYKIKNRDGVMDRVFDTAVKTLGSRLPEILNAMADKAVEDRDLEAAKFCLEVTGKMHGNVFKGRAGNSAQQVNINFSNIPRPDNGETIDVGGDS